MRKIPKKYASLVFTFYATMMMAFIMSAVLIAWPIAFFSLLCVRPLVVKLVDWTLEL